ncbi:hypothetical protein SAMN05421595_2107 [Austwickia chelonae]|uniref:Phosphodiester glycosidase domain-containing protein n=1 Tax=Austwickia chelonae NBRC 105200 TaxID=1184607 RepID=K6UL66_9MICO|nr:hypothetical protein [Austwickia chelonae]GAB76971.1 hypothetical protein AUCHE_04_00110 [Austwickia chelonae NBRC 105200]SEW32873.1 hypothetical protein SAMN05421595_2107 [Austwickia chelonae]
MWARKKHANRRATSAFLLTVVGALVVASSGCSSDTPTATSSGTPTPSPVVSAPIVSPAPAPTPVDEMHSRERAENSPRRIAKPARHAPRPAQSSFGSGRCTSYVVSANGRSLNWHEIRNTTVGNAFSLGRAPFSPVRAAYTGGGGDISNRISEFVATDAQGRLHLLRSTVTGPGNGRSTAAEVTPVLIGHGFSGITALGGRTWMPTNGRGEIYAVDAAGRLQRYLLHGKPEAPRLSAPTTLATGLVGVTALKVDPLHLNGVAAADPDATRVLLVHGGALKQVIVRSDGLPYAPITLTAARPALNQATALSRMTCLGNDGRVSNNGGLIVHRSGGAAAVLGGTYGVGVAVPSGLRPVGTTTKGVPGLLMG